MKTNRSVFNAVKTNKDPPYTYVLNNPIYFIDPDGMEEVLYKSRYDAYGQKIDEQEAPIGNNTEMLSYNKNDDNENKSSATASGIEFDGVLGDRPGRWDLLSEKSFRFKKLTKTANFRVARITNMYFTIEDPSTGKVYESFFSLEIGVPIKGKTGKVYNQKKAVDDSAKVFNAVSTQIMLFEDFLATPQIRDMTLSNATLPYIFATFAQSKLNNYIPGSTITANTYNYNVVEKSAVWVNMFKGIIERLE